MPPLQAPCQKGYPRGTCPGWQPHVTAPFLSCDQLHYATPEALGTPCPASLNPIAQSLVGKVRQAGSKRVDEKHPHLSSLYLPSLVCLKFFPNHSAVRGMLYLSADEVKDRSHIPEMQKLQCSSACGGKTKDGVLMVETHTLQTAFPYSVSQNSGLALLSPSLLSTLLLVSLRWSE